MGAGQSDLPVDDDDIESIEDWREAINEFLQQKYSMRLLCEIDPRSGARFAQIKDAFPSPSTMATKKSRAAELHLIEPDIRSTDEGYGTHTYWVLTEVGKHIRAELQRRQIATLHSQLKPLEQQMKHHRAEVRDNGLEMPVDPLVVFHGGLDE
jgi:DNA-binding HxlR family transcriptional regulator